MQRSNLILDIFDWWTESRLNNQPTEQESQDFTEQLLGLEDEALVTAWYSTVGEWILSRDDVITGENYEEELDQVFELVLSGRDQQPHGYIGGSTPRKKTDPTPA